MTNLKNRINIEKRIVKKTIESILAAGHMVSVFDGEAFSVKRSTNKKAILAATMSTEEDQIIVRDKEGNKLGWISFVYGNDGYDVISDYSVALEDLLKPVNEYAERLAA